MEIECDEGDVCNECIYMIEHEDPDKWEDHGCGKCGKTKEELIRQQAINKYKEVTFTEVDVCSSNSIEASFPNPDLFKKSEKGSKDI